MQWFVALVFVTSNLYQPFFPPPNGRIDGQVDGYISRS